VSGPELRRALEEVFAKSADRPLFFDADPGADYNRIVEILDECSAAGVARIAVVNRRPPRR
jgi:biopolymer transport protein ExbD